MEEFVFVGYLIQEPYWKNWPKREGYHVASIESEFHPKFNAYQWNKVDGIDNPTRFLTSFPDLARMQLEPHRCQSVFHKQSPGWVVSGYAFPRDVVTHRTITSVDKKDTLVEFKYATKMHRTDNLNLLGYEIVDQDDLFLSILNNCGYSVEQVNEMAGPLNEYGLLSSTEDAERFKESIKTDKSNPRIIPDHNQGIIVQVWGTH